jgi:hypothetical protein
MRNFCLSNSIIEMGKLPNQKLFESFLSEIFILRPNDKNQMIVRLVFFQKYLLPYKTVFIQSFSSDV